VQQLIADLVTARAEDRATEREIGDVADPAQPLAEQGVDDALALGLRDRLTALDRALQRVEDGTYGRSMGSRVRVSTRCAVGVPVAARDERRARQRLRNHDGYRLPLAAGPACPIPVLVNEWSPCRFRFRGSAAIGKPTEQSIPKPCAGTSNLPQAPLWTAKRLLACASSNAGERRSRSRLAALRSLSNCMKSASD
jgi:hypothetical protein